MRMIYGLSTLLALLTVAPSLAMAKTNDSIEKLKYSRETHRVINGAIEEAFGDQKYPFFYSSDSIGLHALISYQIMDGVFGVWNKQAPPEEMSIIADDLWFLSGGRRHSYREKTAVIIDPINEKLVAAAIRYYPCAEWSPKTKDWLGTKDISCIDHAKGIIYCDEDGSYDCAVALPIMKSWLREHNVEESRFIIRHKFEGGGEILLAKEITESNSGLMLTPDIHENYIEAALSEAFGDQIYPFFHREHFYRGDYVASTIAHQIMSVARRIPKSKPVIDADTVLLSDCYGASCLYRGAVIFNRRTQKILAVALRYYPCAEWGQEKEAQLKEQGISCRDVAKGIIYCDKASGYDCAVTLPIMKHWMSHDEVLASVYDIHDMWDKIYAIDDANLTIRYSFEGGGEQRSTEELIEAYFGARVIVPEALAEAFGEQKYPFFFRFQRYYNVDYPPSAGQISHQIRDALFDRPYIESVIDAGSFLLYGCFERECYNRAAVIFNLPSKKILAVALRYNVCGDWGWKKAAQMRKQGIRCEDDVKHILYCDEDSGYSCAVTLPIMKNWLREHGDETANPIIRYGFDQTEGEN